jgi:hypothetical protein
MARDAMDRGRVDERERRGDHDTATQRDPQTERRERMRRGGGGYDAGPGREGMPSAGDLDRPQEPCGTFDRYGERRGGIDRGIRRIQDAHKND